MIQPSTQQWQRDHLGPSFQREIAWLRVEHLRTTRIFAATFGPLIDAMHALATSLAAAIDTMNTRAER